MLCAFTTKHFKSIDSQSPCRGCGEKGKKYSCSPNGERVGGDRISLKVYTTAVPEWLFTNYWLLVCANAPLVYQETLEPLTLHLLLAGSVAELRSDPPFLYSFFLSLPLLPGDVSLMAQRKKDSLFAV